MPTSKIAALLVGDGVLSAASAAAVEAGLRECSVTRANPEPCEDLLRTRAFDVCVAAVQNAEEAASIAAVCEQVRASVLVLATCEAAAALPPSVAVLPVVQGGEPLLTAAVSALVGELARKRKLAERVESLSLALESARLGERRATLERLRALVDASPLATIGLDADGRIASWNPAAERLYRFTAAEIAGKPLSFLDAPPATGAAAFEGDVLQRRSDGQLLAVRLWTSILRDEAGDSDGAVVLAEDVTALRALEERSRRTQRIDAAGRLAGGVAHDFNNLLTVILGLGEVLAEDPSLSDAARADMVEIRAAAARAAELTRQLLAVSSRQVLRPVVLDLNELLAQTRPFLQRAIGDAIALRITTCEESAKVRADPTQLERVLLNLAVNARDAMPGGGTLSVWTSVDAPQGAVLLSVQDTGSGMSDETLHHLFEPFFTTKERGKGTGLGLATVYGIVQQSGGTVAAKSELGKGSCFTLSLPCAAPAESSAGATAAEAEPQKGGSGTVLVVEDEAAVRKLVTRVLRGAGYEVLEAFGGSVALQLARNHPGPIDLLVVDVVMPGMNGRETADAIAKLRPGIPALFISGYTDEIIARHGVLEAGVQLLPKPFTSRELLGRVQQLLHAAEPSARLG